MKLLIKLKSLFFLIFIFLYSSCNYGISNGSDLVGRWMLVTNQYNEYISFSSDGTGYYQTYSGSSWTSKDFIWSMSQGSTYKIVKLSGELDAQYEYYFSINKDYLYMNDISKHSLNEWSKDRSY